MNLTLKNKNLSYTYPYPRMMVTVDTVIFLFENENTTPKVLLIKRGNDPFKNSYALPGGFPEMDELLVHAAKRELHEETGLKNIELIQLATYDAVERDPRGRNVALAFIGKTTPKNCTLKAGDDASEAKWFSIQNLPKLAFDHKLIIEDAVVKLGLK
ncbi:MAG TPA: NUDIX hydrolase [Tenuifilaceae bacterium]|nr:NUDIX hydrolase [Tenuifilaceae bacterium]HPE19340.1 NUDIX hydrolase [Tenuifilaceae bacterium]HPJ44452.1 NUDIX hydrolase [Tenuifilaceae bacterium]HPQ35334.1 NUDIX hydrolase [Tenuifilaceae bacterium]HRX69079.1 NUDIX hydrolase [Tenuifilaceae bacterium]